MNHYVKAAIATIGSLSLFFGFAYGCYLTKGWLFFVAFGLVLLSMLYMCFLSEFGG